MGYPKYIADKITLDESDGKWIGTVSYKMRTPMRLEFSPGHEREPLDTEKWFADSPAFFAGSSINLIPPEKGPGIMTSLLDHKVDPQ